MYLGQTDAAAGSTFFNRASRKTLLSRSMMVASVATGAVICGSKAPKALAAFGAWYSVAAKSMPYAMGIATCALEKAPSASGPFGLPAKHDHALVPARKTVFASLS